MIRLRRPAPLADLAAMTAALSPPAFLAKFGAYGAAATHLAHTRSWGFWAGDLCVACAGLHELGPHALEAWFACRPQASRHMVGVIGTMRLTLPMICEAERVEIRARVAEGWEPGRRIARALDFHLAEAGAVETWIRGRA